MENFDTTEELEEVLVEDEVSDSDSGEQAQLIVYNDDHNTFDWVIQCFTEILNHTQAQAEQLSLIIHFKGKATVKRAVLKGVGEKTNRHNPPTVINRHSPFQGSILPTYGVGIC